MQVKMRLNFWKESTTQQTDRIPEWIVKTIIAAFLIGSISSLCIPLQILRIGFYFGESMERLKAQEVHIDKSS